MSASKRASLKGKNPLDELFRKTESAEEVRAHPEAAPKVKSAPEPVKKPPHLRQTTVMLYDHHLDWLAQKCIEARKGGGKPIRKAVLIRSLLDLAMSAPVDLKGLVGEDQIVERLEEAIRSQ